MTLTLFTGTANPQLGAAVARALDVALGACEVGRFPDGELHVEVRESVRGHDVYLVQPTAPPAEQHLFELLFLADACTRAGAARVTAVLPYFGYARQDRRASGREAVGARLVADLIGTRQFARVVVLDLHSAALEGFFGAPVEHLTAVPTLADVLGGERAANGVVVAPDGGAAKLAERYAKALHLPLAIVQKVRVSGTEVAVRGLTGDVRNRAPVIVDDMISTGGTVAAAAAALIAGGSEPELTVVASHGLFAGPAVERLRALRLRRLLVTDSVALPAVEPLPVGVVSVAPLLAEAVSRLHHDRSLGDLLVHE
ncbi:MAG TPA: ribose-phosphate pyrophosphokinase [Gemmatimonadales bacterium]|nr:ribose-phosphate pyrophosphokinase [Gemmatimonadales bacterium]